MWTKYLWRKAITQIVVCLFTEYTIYCKHPMTVSCSFRIQAYICWLLITSKELVRLKEHQHPQKPLKLKRLIELPEDIRCAYNNRVRPCICEQYLFYTYFDSELYSSKVWNPANVVYTCYWHFYRLRQTWQTKDLERETKIICITFDYILYFFIFTNVLSMHSNFVQMV